MTNILSGESSFGMDLWEMEESVRTSEWQKWVKHAERLAGHSLDGDQEEDGYSLDFAHDAFEAGLSPKQYVSGIAKRQAH